MSYIISIASCFSVYTVIINSPRQLLRAHATIYCMYSINETLYNLFHRANAYTYIRAMVYSNFHDILEYGCVKGCPQGQTTVGYNTNTLQNTPVYFTYCHHGMSHYVYIRTSRIIVDRYVRMYVQCHGLQDECRMYYRGIQRTCDTRINLQLV